MGVKEQSTEAQHSAHSGAEDTANDGGRRGDITADVTVAGHIVPSQSQKPDAPNFMAGLKRLYVVDMPDLESEITASHAEHVHAHVLQVSSKGASALQCE